MDTPDLIVVEVVRETEIAADGAQLDVKVNGDYLFSGGAALDRSREVRELITALGAHGIGPELVQLTEVHLQTSTKIGVRSSSAVFRVRVALPTLDLLPAAMAVIAGAKNTEMGDINWQYDTLEAVRGEMLLEALREAEQRADLICAALGHAKLGVHALSETLVDWQAEAWRQRDAPPTVMAMGGSMMRLASQLDLGFALTHSKPLTLKLRVEYLVRPLSPGKAGGTPQQPSEGAP